MFYCDTKERKMYKQKVQLKDTDRLTCISKPDPAFTNSRVYSKLGFLSMAQLFFYKKASTIAPSSKIHRVF